LKKKDTTSSNWLRRIRTAFLTSLLYLQTLAFCFRKLKDLTVVYLSYKNIDLKNSINMDAEQRYIEEANFEFEDMAYDKIISLGNLGYHLAMTIHEHAHKIPVNNGIIQKFGVMVEDAGDIPFQVKIFHQEDDVPILVDMDEIDIDEYLDLMNQNKSITHEGKKKTKSVSE
jgi:hypothetical protein